jgi:hypothetical protein
LNFLEDNTFKVIGQKDSSEKEVNKEIDSIRTFDCTMVEICKKIDEENTLSLQNITDIGKPARNSSLMRLTVLEKLILSIEKDPEECREYNVALNLIKCENGMNVWNEEAALRGINIIRNKIIKYFPREYIMNASWASLYDEFKICKSENVKNLILENKIEFLTILHQKVFKIVEEKEIYEKDADRVNSYNDAVKKLDGSDTNSITLKERIDTLKERVNDLMQVYKKKIISKNIIHGEQPSVQNPNAAISLEQNSKLDVVRSMKSFFFG